MNTAQSDAAATFLGFLSNAMMRKQEAKDEFEREQIRAEMQEKALEDREVKRENRAAKKVTGRSDAYHTPGAFGADYRVDKLNAAGETVGMERANPREKQGYDARIAQATEEKRLADEAARIKEEDRQFKRKDTETRTGIMSRNAASNEARAAKSGSRGTEERPERYSKKDALATISSLAYKADDGETWIDVAKRSGVDPEPILRAANKDAPARGPSGRPAGKPVMAQNSPKQEKKDGPPKSGQVVDGYRFLGGDPGDPKNWEQVR